MIVRMSDPADEPSYPPYRPPADPQPEPEPQRAARYQAYPAPAVQAAPAGPVPSTAAASPTSRNPLGLTLSVVAGLAMLIAVAIGGVLLLGESSGPGQVDTPTGPISTDDSEIRAELEEKRDLYTAALRAGDLPSIGLEDNEFNRTAVAAYAFFLTDMIGATAFGVDDDEAAEFARDAAEYERLLLAGEPLGDDITISFSEDRVFTYDGDTGEGGYQDPTSPDAR
jgi:hypothetical protein